MDADVDVTVTVRRAGRPTEHRPLREGELADRLVELAVPLSDDEMTRLLEIAGRLRAR